MTTKTYTVPGISCEHCVRAISEEVSSVEGVDAVDVSVLDKTVTVSGAATSQAVEAAIIEAGYEVLK